MYSNFLEQEKIKQAILQFTVNLVGVLLIGVGYLNFLLLKPYARHVFSSMDFLKRGHDTQVFWTLALRLALFDNGNLVYFSQSNVKQGQTIFH
jgi:hypothetical protein